MSIFRSLGRIQLIMGPMFSGKSTQLLRRLNRYRIAQKKFILFKNSIDQWYGSNGFVTTHDNQKMEGRWISKLSDLQYEDYERFDIIGVDQGQFFQDIAEKSDQFANQGKIVIVSALDGTFQRKPFKNIANLIAKADYITKLTAVCHLCGADAAFSKRIVDAQDTVVVGGEESYRPMCRSCFGKV